MAASPAYAGLTPPSLPLPVLGSACNALTSLPSTLQCVNGIVTTITSTLPVCSAASAVRWAAVQAPLIAAGDRASRAADSVFTRFGGQALPPGLLVVLGTALVAAVGAGNLRTWQGRLASKRAKTSA